MRIAWIVAVGGLAVAAGAAMMFSTPSAPERPDGAPFADATPVSGRRSLPGAPRTNQPQRSMFGGGVSLSEASTMRAPIPTRHTEEALTRRARPAAQPVNITTTPDSPHSFDSLHAGNVQGKRQPLIAASTSDGGVAARNAEMDRRRQQMEIERRRRQAEAQNALSRRGQFVQQAAGGMVAQPFNAQTPGVRTPNNEAEASRDPNRKPTLEEVLAMLPPGARNQTGNGSSTLSTNSGNNSSNGNSQGNSSQSGNSGSNSGNSNSGSSGGSGGGGGPVSTSGNASVLTLTAVWLPVDNRACSAMAGLRTNDLYLRLSNDSPILSVNSGSADGLALTGGAFFQNPVGSDINPSTAALSSNNCLAFDSYLNDFGIIQPNSPSLQFDSRLVASWLNFQGQRGAADPSRFLDDAFYLHIGRFSAPSNITGLSGKLAVGAGILGVNFRTLSVDVAFDAALWRDDSNFNRPAPPPSSGNNGNTGGNGGTGGTPGNGGTGGTPGDGGTGGTPGNGGTGGTPGNGGTGGTPGNGGTGGDGGDGGSDPDPSPTGGAFPAPPYDSQALIAVWKPINNNGCTESYQDEGQTVVVANLSSSRTADLYFRMATPFSLQFVSTSNATTPAPRQAIQVTSGSFFQHPFGGNKRPTAAEIASLPCVAFDSFVTIDTANTAETRQIQAFQVNWNNALEGVWVVSGFALSSAEPAIKDAVKFPADPNGYYVRVARMTATEGASITGMMEAGIVRMGEGRTTQVQVQVSNCPTCFAPPSN